MPDFPRRDSFEEIVYEDERGWAAYACTQFTSGAPFLLAANTPTALPNNAGLVLDRQKPRDVPSFYEGGRIRSQNGDALVLNIDFFAVPTTTNATVLDLWLDIGGPVGEFYRHSQTFPKGQNVPHAISRAISVYTLDTWAANGAQVRVEGNGPFSLYAVRYVITRVHKARR